MAMKLFKLAMVLFMVAAGAAALAWWRCLSMPGNSFQGPRPPLDEEDRARADRLEEHVVHLASTIGPRNLRHPEALAQARDYVKSQFEEMGYVVQEQHFTEADQTFTNLWVDVPGTTRPDEFVVVGGHYDSCFETPGADDNASGTAGALELARMFQGRPVGPTLRFAAFVNEEPPFFQQRPMGSLVMAKAMAAEGKQVHGMISLEMLGDWRDEPGSQLYPAGLEYFFPPQGDFIGFVGNHRSRDWVHEMLSAFRETATVPSVGIASPPGVIGVDLSDHWSFWQAGYPALMVTDGGPFRNTRYHTDADTPDTLDYDRMTRVVTGLAAGLAKAL